MRSEGGTRFLTISSGKQVALLAFGFVFVLWSFVATSALLISALWPENDRSQVSVLTDAYEARIAALSSEAEILSRDAEKTHRRFYAALDQIFVQQDALLFEIAERRKLETTLDVVRGKLSDAVIAHNEARSRNQNLTAQMQDITTRVTARRDDRQDMSDTLGTISTALSEAVRNRDNARTEIADLEETLARFEIKTKVNAERQNLLLTRLEEAVAMSFAPLDKMFENSGVDVDGLMAQVRRNYSGTGGPLYPAAVSTKSLSDDTSMNTLELESSFRFSRLMLDLQSLNLVQIAAAQIPFAQPVHARFRSTSGFGLRHDPKTGGSRMHKGSDFAAPRGTPILATADGEVIFASVQSGYGKFIKIRHAAGFVTAYAHLSGIDVKAGQKVTRGEQIGRMGNSGRSTGNHLHYEVRLDGKPVNPMTYLKAAENVY